jgi:hypothetical protein
MEDDWKLPADGTRLSRTRGGGLGRPSLERASLGHVDTADEDSDEDIDDESLEDEAPETAPAPVATTGKPTHTRVMLEVAHLQDAFANYPCPSCSEPVEMKLRTMCIATSIEFKCHNKDCAYTCDLARPITTTIHADDRHAHPKMTDYAINVLFVLGFISVGDGCTEAARLLGLLGLPNDTTMMQRSFGIIEERIGRFVRELCDEIIASNIDEEAKLSMNECDYNVWKMWTSDEANMGPVPVDRMPRVDASYDMAWQQKGSGHQYNSQSGHGSLFGRYSRKIIGLVIKSKLCNFCEAFKKSNPGVDEAMIPEHHCWKNHNGSSGSMESSGAVDVLVEAFVKRKVVIQRLCCDDDSSIRADCQWSNADYLMNNGTDTLPKVAITKGKNKGKLQDRPDKGKLPAFVPEPEFVADPNHRRKGLTGSRREVHDDKNGFYKDRKELRLHGWHIERQGPYGVCGRR